MKSYRSKIDIWFILLMGIVLGFGIYGAISKSQWLALILTFSIFNILILSFLTLKYSIENEILLVKMKYVIFAKIDIKTIKSIEKSRNLLSSPAFSIDRLSVQYGKFDEILISPKDKDSFIKDLLSINPAIIVKV